MKLIIQIPCFNEAETLPETLLALPRKIDGITAIEYMVIDDGSSDDTVGVAHNFGVHHIVRHRRNRGLAAAYQTGLNAALAAGADIIVNTDADNQYDGRDIEKLVLPILNGEADIVVGDRQVRDHSDFSWLKRRLQVFGTRVVQFLSGAPVTDAVSGFRAVSRQAAQRLFILSRFSYTTEMLIQAGRKGLKAKFVPVRTNFVKRSSRLARGMLMFVVNQFTIILRVYAMYNPLRIFVVAGMAASLAGALPLMRFLWFWANGDSQGHVQSLIFGSLLLNIGIFAAMFGIVADLIGRNRQLLEMSLERIHKLDDQITDIQSTRERRDLVEGYEDMKRGS